MEHANDILEKLWEMDLFHRDIKGNNFIVADQDHNTESKNQVLDLSGCVDLKIQIK